jgi:hypothetical protein
MYEIIDINIVSIVDDLNRLREYADKKGGNQVSHYIREAVGTGKPLHSG